MFDVTSEAASKRQGEWSRMTLGHFFNEDDPDQQCDLSFTLARITELDFRSRIGAWTYTEQGLLAGTNLRL